MIIGSYEELTKCLNYNFTSIKNTFNLVGKDVGKLMKRVGKLERKTFIFGVISITNFVTILKLSDEVSKLKEEKLTKNE